MTRMIAKDPNVISLAEAAELLGVSDTTAYRMARAGDFPGLIPIRHSGTRRTWKVSLPRFARDVHGTAEAS